MVKNNLPRDVATVIFADCELAAGADYTGVWEVTLTSPLVLLATRDEEPMIFPVGAVFYIPMGQMDLWVPLAKKLGRAKMIALATEADPTLVERVAQLQQEEEIPF